MKVTLENCIIGLRVKYTSGNFGDHYQNPKWGGLEGKIWGVITRLNDQVPMPLQVDWDNGGSNSYHYNDLSCDEPILPDDIFDI
jgi:hypothetical protein